MLGHNRPNQVFICILPLVASFLLTSGIKALLVWDNFHNVGLATCHFLLRFTLTVASPTDSPMTFDFLLSIF